MMEETTSILPSMDLMEGDFVPEDAKEIVAGSAPGAMLRGTSSITKVSECLPIVVWNPALDQIYVWIKVREEDGSWTAYNKDALPAKKTKNYGGCHKWNDDSFKVYAEVSSSGISDWNGCSMESGKKCYNNIAIDVPSWYQFYILRL